MRCPQFVCDVRFDPQLKENYLVPRGHFGTDDTIVNKLAVSPEVGFGVFCLCLTMLRLDCDFSSLAFMFILFFA